MSFIYVQYVSEKILPLEKLTNSSLSFYEIFTTFETNQKTLFCFHGSIFSIHIYCIYIMIHLFL